MLQYDNVTGWQYYMPDKYFQGDNITEFYNLTIFPSKSFVHGRKVIYEYTSVI